MRYNFASVGNEALHLLWLYSRLISSPTCAAVLILMRDARECCCYSDLSSSVSWKHWQNNDGFGQQRTQNDIKRSTFWQTLGKTNWTFCHTLAYSHLLSVHCTSLSTCVLDFSIKTYLTFTLNGIYTTLRFNAFLFNAFVFKLQYFSLFLFSDFYILSEYLYLIQS